MVDLQLLVTKSIAIDKLWNYKSGKNIKKKDNNLLRMAASSTQGMLVAPSTRIPSLLFPTPTKPDSFSQHEHFLLPSYRVLSYFRWLCSFLLSRIQNIINRWFDTAHFSQSDSRIISSSPCIWTRNSVLMRRAASLSFSFLEPHSESTSSMKMIEGLCWRARSNRFFTSLGDRGIEGKVRQAETARTQQRSSLHWWLAKGGATGLGWKWVHREETS